MKMFFLIVTAVASATHFIPAIESTCANSAHADTQTAYYARINEGETYLYSMPTLAPDAQIFALPATYFVLLTGNAGDTENAFYSASYNGINGFVQKSAVTPVEGTPLRPYADNLSFRVFVPGGTDLRSTPAASTPFNIVTALPYATTNLVYYGSQPGEEVIAQRGNEWYYCKYISGPDAFFGYVYAGFCDLLPALTPSQEQLPAVTDEIFTQTSATAPDATTAPTLAKEVQVILIIGISIPCILIIYLLFKPTKLMTPGRKRKKPAKSADYYEMPPK